MPTETDELLLRQLPHSVEAEQAVLGSMLIDPRCVSEVIDKLRPDDFYIRQNKEIYETIYSMFNYSLTIDPVTVVDRMKQDTARAGRELHALFVFAEEAFGQGNEMLILVTELTVNNISAQFIAAFGSPDYDRHNEELMLSQRSSDIQQQIAQLEL